MDFAEICKPVCTFFQDRNVSIYKWYVVLLIRILACKLPIGFRQWDCNSLISNYERHPFRESKAEKPQTFSKYLRPSPKGCIYYIMLLPPVLRFLHQFLLLCQSQYCLPKSIWLLKYPHAFVNISSMVLHRISGHNHDP